jgi:hypothetical protein
VKNKIKKDNRRSKKMRKNCAKIEENKKMKKNRAKIEKTNNESID